MSIISPNMIILSSRPVLCYLSDMGVAGPGAKTRLKSEKGFTLLETVIALGIVGLIIVILLQALPVAIIGTSRTRAGMNLINLASSQMEHVKVQPFQASYTPMSSVPPGFSVAITATVPVTYTYTSPSLAQTADTVQLITVTVTGPYGSGSVEGYKTRR